MKGEEYNPTDSLKKEVSRFFETNSFNPMEVTNFYAQARVVLSDMERMQKRLDNQKATIKALMVSHSLVFDRIAEDLQEQAGNYCSCQGSDRLMCQKHAMTFVSQWLIENKERLLK